MKYLSILIIVLFTMNSAANAQQNHVPNGNFEDYTQCPTSWGWITRCTGWSDYSPSSDYYNCTHMAPNRTAHSGNGYAGSSPMYSTPSQGLSERIQRPIIPLIPGMKYEVSMSVRIAQNTRYATNNLGVFFYNAGYPTGVPTPQVTFLQYGIIRDSSNWKRIVSTFTADSAYSNIVIGGFYNSNTFAMDTFSNNGATYAYYIYDSVVVKQLDSFYVSVSDSIFCVADTIQANYNTSKKYNSNNIFTAQLSDKSGSFSSPINLGTRTSDTSGVINCIIPSNIANGIGYKVRVIASSPADTTKNQSINLKIANIDSSAVTTSSNSPICEGNALNLSSGTNVTGTTYQWTGPNGFNTTLANTTIGGASPIHNGNYLITMKFYGCEVTDTLPVTIKPLPAKPTANSNTPICASATINLTATTSTPSVTYSWTGPNGFISTTQNPSLSNSTVAMSGDYIVAADLNGCKRTDTTTVTVKPLPTSVMLSNNSALCAGDTLKLNSTASTTGATYSWAGPNSFAAATQNAAVPNSLANMTGWYKMTVDLNGCLYKDSTYATVHPIPATPLVGFNNPLCVGETLNLTATTVSGATYSWTGANNFTANTQNPSRSSITTSDAGVYNVTATVNGCKSPAGSATIAINASPFVVIFPTPSDSICQGDPVVFTALPNNAGGTPQYRWLVNAQQVGTGTVFNASALSNGDVVRCDMTEYTKCSSPYTDQSNDIEMKVLPWLAPSVTISANPNRPLEVDEFVTFTATPINGGSAPLYQWKRNGQNIQGATSNIWSANTLNDNDKITVELTSNYKCPQPPTAASNSITVRVATSIGKTYAIKGLTLYPNPNNGKFLLKGVVNSNEKMLLEIINAVGQVIHRDTVIPLSGSINKEIDLPDMADGIYLLRINGMNGNIAQIKFSIY